MTNSFLPEIYKKTIRREKILRLTMLFLGLLSAAAFLCMIFMLPSYFILAFSKDDVLRRLHAEEEVLAKKELKKLEEEIGGVNLRSTAYKKGEDQRKNILPILADLANSAPAGIKFSSITLIQNNPKKNGEFVITLRGDAKTREDLISYIEKLKSNDKFSAVRSPVTNLLQASDVAFFLELVLKPEFYSYGTN